MIANLPGWQRLTGFLRNPREALTLSRGNIELWANLLIILCALVFMLLKGATFAVTLTTVFGIWAMLSISLNLVVGLYRAAFGRPHRVLWAGGIYRSYPDFHHLL